MTELVDRRRTGAWLNAAFAVLLVMGLGAAVRIFQIAFADFPPGDGGMFYRMIEDLVRGGFRLPAFTSYNDGTIPFVYLPQAIGRYEKLQACGTQPITCVEVWLGETAIPSTEHDYLYIAYRAFDSYALLESVRTSRNYERIYENSHAVIFRKR